MRCLAAMAWWVGAWTLAFAVESVPATAPVSAVAPAGHLPTPGPTATPEDPWAGVMRAFASADADDPRTGGVVFTGSSSIRLWTDLEHRYQPYSAINRGFGGSTVDDLIHHVDQLVLPHRPRLVVVYSGDNDLAQGKSARQVAQDFASLCDRIRERLPHSEIALLSIKPSPARIHLLPTTREANALIRTYASTKPYLHYVDVFSPMLDRSGKPRAELFAEDGLHLNERGYALWDSVIAPILSMRDAASPRVSH